ncbi:MAG: hypothetical protein WC655_25615, partial [Candidatus Hydrogenedentales bacterium]
NTYTTTQNVLSWRNWVFFYDDFTAGNYNGWTTSGGTWSVTAGGSLTRTPAAGDASVYRFHPNPSDSADPDYKNHEFVVDFDYKLNSATNGVDAFLENEVAVAGSGLYLEIRSGTIRLRLKNSATVLATYTGSSALNTWYRIYAELDGANVKVYRSTGGGAGTLILSTTAAPVISSEQLLFVVKDNANVELDNISVRSDKGTW